MIEVNWPISSCASSVSAVAVCAVTPAGSSDWIALDELLLGGSLLRGDRDRVVLAFAVQELLRRRDREHRERRCTEAVQAAVLGDTDELESPFRNECRDLHGVAERVALPICSTCVDHDLVRRGRPAALEEVQRVELRVLGIGVDPEPEARRTAGADGVAVGLEDLGVRLVEDGSGRELDLVDLPHRLEQRRVDGRRRSRGPVDADVGAFALHDGVGPGVRLREEVRERLVDRVREDVGAADHRDAEDDRDAREQRASLLPSRPRIANAGHC